MKKLEVGKLENENGWESEVLNFFENFDLESISTLNIEPGGIGNTYFTLFLFETKTNDGIQFYYYNNETIHAINIEKNQMQIGSIELINDEKDEEKQKWLDDIWDQFADYFNLRIRLMFINEKTPWKWKTEFTY